MFFNNAFFKKYVFMKGFSFNIMQINYGDIIQLGKHKLMCGDATNIQDIQKLIDNAKIDLILTDPPYGMKIQHKDGTIGGESSTTPILCGGKGPKYARKYSVMQGDKDQNTFRKNYELTKNLCKKKIIWGAQYFADFLPVNGGWIFWDKKSNGNMFSDGEFAYKSWGRAVKKYSHLWNGCLREGKHTWNGRYRCHPTQKPVELHIKILQDFSHEYDLILDCFGGSGTTLIAAELSNRRCYMMEISPDYCELIIERFRNISLQLKI